MRCTALPIAACLALLAGCNDASESEGEGSKDSPSKTAEATPNNKALSDKCNATKLTALVGAIDAAEPSARGEIVADKLTDACEVPEAIPAFFSVFAGQTSEVRSISANAGAKIHDALGEVCKGHGVIMQQLSQSPAEERHGLLYDRCDFKRFGLIDRKAWVRGRQMTGVPLYAYQWLIDQGATEAQAESIAMAMLAYAEPKYTIDGQTLAKVAGSLAAVPDGPIVQVAKDRIEFGDKKIVAIDDEGKIDASVRQGHLIRPLYDVLAEEADKAKVMAEARDEEWTPELVIVADASVSFETLVDVMYSAGRAEYSSYSLVADGTNGPGSVPISPPKFGVTPPPAPAMRVLVTADGFTLPTMDLGESPAKIDKSGDGEYDYAALGTAASEFLEENDKSTLARVSAETDIEVDVLLQTLVALQGHECASKKDCVLPELVLEAGMSGNFDPEMMARNAGILGTLSADSGHSLASPYGSAFAVGNDDEDVWGGLTGTEVGEAFGVGGLGLVGTGRGGAGTGEGKIGLGNVGMIGKGGGGGSGSGYGRGSGAGFGGRGKKVPKVRQTKATVKGSLDKDIIRRIVRAHINEVRACYNHALVKDPDLEGRVAIQFTIGGTGKVEDSEVETTSLDNEDVGYCMAKAVKRWKFPKPSDGGNVVVTYPFVLEPG